MKTLRQLERERLEKPQQKGFLGGWWRLLLVVLLAVAGLFGYLFYFTDLIRSHLVTPHVPKLMARKALPHKGGPVAVTSATVPPPVAGVTVKPAGEKSVETAHKIEAPPPVKPVQVATPAAVAVTPPKNVAVKVSPPQPPPNVVAAKKPAVEPPRPSVAVPQPASTVAAKPGASPVVTPVIAPVSVVKTPVKSVPQAAPPVEKQQSHKSTASVAPPVKPAAKPAPPVAGGKERYAVRCGPFTGERDLASARVALKKAGMVPVVSTGAKQPTSMYRLHVADFNDAAAAAAEKKKILEAAPDAFVLPHDGVFELIAGSYHEESGGKLEQERLLAWGVTVQLTQVVAPVTTRQLTAGAFPTRETAAVLAEKLKKNGISCVVVGHR
jgi:hypothetical protein